MSELLIGTRRPGRHRRLRSLALLALLLAVAGFVSYLLYRRVVSYDRPTGGEPKGAPAARAVTRGQAGGPDVELAWGDCSLSHRGPLAVVRLAGSPYAQGACSGRLLGGRVARVSASLTATIDETVPLGGMIARALHHVRLRWRFRLLDDGTPDADLAEVSGIVRGAGQAGAGGAPGFEDLVRVQAALDVGQPPPWTPGAGYQAVARGLSFAVVGGAPTGESQHSGSGSAAGSGKGSGKGTGTAAAAARTRAPRLPTRTPDHRFLLGRSFGLPGAGDGGESAQDAPVVSLVHPDGAIAYASVGWPGLVGVVTGMNAQGIAVLVNPAASSDVRIVRAAEPIALIARDVMERAHTLDEAIAIVEHSSPLGAAGFLLADGRSRALAWVERSPGRVRVVRSPSPPSFGDVLITEPFLQDPDNDRARRSRPSPGRVSRAADLARRAQAAGPADVVAILRDAAEVDGSGLPAGHRGAIDDPEAVHTAVLDPVGMTLWVADGPGAGARFRAFDLASLLGAAAQRAVPPADVPADPARDPAVAREVVAARRDLRAARVARDAGHLGRARELAARALSWRRDLPEALLLSGQLARAGGDDAGARDDFRRYLEGGADDLAAEQQVRAFLGEE